MSKTLSRDFIASYCEVLILFYEINIFPDTNFASLFSKNLRLLSSGSLWLRSGSPALFNGLIFYYTVLGWILNFYLELDCGSK